MAKIAVNGRFRGLSITGIERYAREIWNRFPTEGVRLIEPRNSLSGWRGILWEQTVLPSKVRKQETLLSLTNLGPISKKRQVLVLHDVAVLDHPEWFSAKVKWTYQMLLPVLAKTVEVIVTDSEFSRQRIVERLGLNENRVIRIYPGCGSNFKVETELTRKEHYVLAYGADDPRKNFGRLLQAWGSVRREFPDYTLKIFGRPTQLFANTASDDWIGVEHLGYVPDIELPDLYRKASLVVYPSLYEGFGLPVLEALASATPAVVSDIEVFRELFNGSVTFVDPLSVESIAHGIMTSLKETRPFNKALSAGLLSRFDFDHTTRRLNEIAASI